MRLNSAHILSSCSACLVGMRSPEFGMHWFGVSRNIWMARQDCDFEYCSAHFLLQSPVSSHPLIPLPMAWWGNPPSSGLRDLFHSSCDRGVGRSTRAITGQQSPKSSCSVHTCRGDMRESSDLSAIINGKKHVPTRHSLPLLFSSSSVKAIPFSQPSPCF